MLTRCYLGELYKRGSLPLPPQLRPAAADGGAGAGPGAAGMTGSVAGAGAGARAERMTGDKKGPGAVRHMAAGSVNAVLMSGSGAGDSVERADAGRISGSRGEAAAFPMAAAARPVDSAAQVVRARAIEADSVAGRTDDGGLPGLFRSTVGAEEAYPAAVPTGGMQESALPHAVQVTGYAAGRAAPVVDRGLLPGGLQADPDQGAGGRSNGSHGVYEASGGAFTRNSEPSELSTAGLGGRDRRAAAAPDGGIGGGDRSAPAGWRGSVQKRNERQPGAVERVPRGMSPADDPLLSAGFPDPATALRIAKAARWLTGDHRPGLLLYGTVGSGKSTLARAICELIGVLHDSPLRSERLAVARTSAPELVELKAPREARTAADCEELFARLRSAPMLLIDDLGVEATAVRAWGNCLTPVIDLLYYRYDRRLFTIVTTNLDAQALEAAYGVRIADRMAEMFDRIGHTGPSYRR